MRDETCSTNILYHMHNQEREVVFVANAKGYLQTLICWNTADAEESLM